MSEVKIMLKFKFPMSHKIKEKSFDTLICSLKCALLEYFNVLNILCFFTILCEQFFVDLYIDHYAIF